ncbi:MAG: hypothetical protein E7295_08855 [Lachnospiraceae bacterium]|nr:hypothetical protein [Lachnospiraceae bacterium]
MPLRKKEYRRRSIEEDVMRGVDKGQITIFAGLFFTLFFAVVLSGYLQMEMIRSSSGYLEDALAASGLAAALIDVREYGSSHVLRIRDANESYEQYCACLKANLGLDENWECENKHLISGQVKLENYTIYNVTGDQVEYCRLDGGGQEWHTGRLGQVLAPNGQVVERTGTYGEISYPFQGLWGLTMQARKGKLVDIVGEN